MTPKTNPEEEKAPEPEKTPSGKTVEELMAAFRGPGSTPEEPKPEPEEYKAEAYKSEEYKSVEYKPGEYPPSLIEAQEQAKRLSAKGTTAPVATPLPVEDKDKEEKLELLKKMADCQKEYGGESNVPQGHDYWKWGNQYRALVNKGK